MNSPGYGLCQSGGSRASFEFKPLSQIGFVHGMRKQVALHQMAPQLVLELHTHLLSLDAFCNDWHVKFTSQ